jgi:hypothetical protein
MRDRLSEAKVQRHVMNIFVVVLRSCRFYFFFFFFFFVHLSRKIISLATRILLGVAGGEEEEDDDGSCVLFLFTEMRDEREPTQMFTFV